MGVCGLVGPTAFTFTFAHFISPESRWQLPGAAFLLAALLLVVGLVIGWQVTRGDEAPRAA